MNRIKKNLRLILLILNPETRSHRFLWAFWGPHVIQAIFLTFTYFQSSRVHGIELLQTMVLAVFSFSWLVKKKMQADIRSRRHLLDTQGTTPPECTLDEPVWFPMILL